MNHQALQSLSARVQHNCHISDARHGGEYQMCTFLMKMREYYRWEKGLPFGARLPSEAVGNWLAQREHLWERLEEEEYRSLEIGGESFDPFAADGVNSRLEAHGLVYSAGLGRNAKPHFFLDRLERRSEPGDCAVFVSDREYARDLGAPPAMTRGNSIYIRRESLRRMLWEKLEEWRWSRPDNAMGRAFSCYDFEGDLDASLDAMTDKETEAVILHERGEHRVGVQLGEVWNDMLLELSGTPAELMARAVRDHLADCLYTLPLLAESGEQASVHFYFGNLGSMRREIFPGLQDTYRKWMESFKSEPLLHVAREGRQHWARLAQRMVDSHHENDPGLADRIVNLVRGNRL